MAATDIYRAQTVITFMINLNGKPMNVTMYIIPTYLPRILGKQWLRNNEVQLDLDTQRMRVNGERMKTENTGTGREGITWDETLHDSEDTEYSDPKEQAPNTNRGANIWRTPKQMKMGTVN